MQQNIDRCIVPPCHALVVSVDNENVGVAACFVVLNVGAMKMTYRSDLFATGTVYLLLQIRTMCISWFMLQYVHVKQGGSAGRTHA